MSLIPCFHDSKILFWMGPGRENNRLVLSDKGYKKKSEFLPQILLIVCYTIFVRNLLPSHSIYWRNKVNVCIKDYDSYDFFR